MTFRFLYKYRRNYLEKLIKTEETHQLLSESDTDTEDVMSSRNWFIKVGQFNMSAYHSKEKENHSFPLTDLKLIDLRKEIHLIPKVTLPDVPFVNLSITGVKIAQTDKN